MNEYSVISTEFDVAFYLALNPSVKEQGLDPVGHFMTEGWKAGLNPNSNFDTKFYLKANPDVAAAGVNPFAHYLQSGKAEGRSTRPAGLAELTTRMIRKIKTIYIDSKYGYPLKELLPHTSEVPGGLPTLASGDYDQIRILDSLTNSEDVLVDVGCGQGRIINYWLEKRMENRIVGIEYDEVTARKTKTRLNTHKNVEIICGDATICTPLDATFIYMFNPFDFPTTQRFSDFIWNNRVVYGRNHLQILLYNCASIDAFDASRFVARRIPRCRGIPYERAIIRLRDQ